MTRFRGNVWFPPGRLLILACCSTISLSDVSADHLAAQEGEPAPKSARSEFEMKTLGRFISSDLSRTSSRGSLVGLGLETRKVHGRVVDHEGRPVGGAMVAVVEAIGYSNHSYDENYDITDQQGRFLVEGDLTKTRLVLRRAAGDIWKVPLKPGQRSARVVWPKLAVCNLTVDPSLCEAGATVTIATTRYWAGMSIMRFTARLDESHQARISLFIPGEYSVSVTRTIQVGGADESAAVEIGHFTIASGETKDVHCRREGRRTVGGKVISPVRNLRLQVERQRTQYEDWPRIVDFVACDAAGRFQTGALGPGRYVLRFVGPLPKRGTRTYAFVLRPLTIRHRLTVGDENKPLHVTVGEKKTGTRHFIQSTLDRQATGRWSNRDMQVSLLVNHADRPAVVAELQRLMNDPLAPHAWKEPVLKSLGQMTATPGVTESLIGKLNSLDPGDFRTRGRVIRAFDDAKHDIPQIINAISPFLRDPDFRIRWGTCFTLARLGQSHAESRRRVIRLLIPLLSDPWDRTRADVAAALGRLGAEEALPALQKTRDDPVGRVRVVAAWAIWKINGDADQAIRLMTSRLNSSNQSGRLESAYMLAEFESLPPITVKALVAAAKFDGKPPFTGNAQVHASVKRSAMATLRKRAPEALPEPPAEKKDARKRPGQRK